MAETEEKFNPVREHEVLGTLIGPMPLDEALAHAAEDENGARMAVSVPNSAMVAMQFEDTISIREVNVMTGQCSSRMNTGRRVSLEEARRHQWRPA